MCSEDTSEKGLFSGLPGPVIQVFDSAMCYWVFIRDGHRHSASALRGSLIIFSTKEGSQVPMRPCHFATKWDFTLFGKRWERENQQQRVLRETEAASFLTSVPSVAVVSDGSQSILQWESTSERTSYSGIFSGLLFHSLLLFQVTIDTEP